MLEEIQIKNFKSILDDTISLGRVNVFIGENGCGKSNILEALMFASLAGTYGTIDSDLLYNNGVRICKPSLILSSFEDKEQVDLFEVDLQFSNSKGIEYYFVPVDKENSFSKWKRIYSVKGDSVNSTINSVVESLQIEQLNELLGVVIEGSIKDKIDEEISKRELNNQIHLNTQDFYGFEDFIIYTLKTETLRGIPEFQKSRKGIYGETLDVIINELSDEEKEELKHYVYTISWADDFFIDENEEQQKKGYKFNNSKSLLYFKDKFMKKDNNVFSSENSNEGILHVLFYLSNIISSKMPRLFAIENIDTSLNPHLCQHVMNGICELTKKREKQLLITTHNPAILDGLDLYDDDIRLFEVFRTDNGDTRTRRIQLTPGMQKDKYKLSELWTRGFLGAISDKF